MEPQVRRVGRLVIGVTAFALAVTTIAVARAGDRAVTKASSRTPSALGAPDRQNIVLILTDDQRFDTLWAMPRVEAQLVTKGIEFTRGYISNPVCCPSRSTILTGLYSHSTGVYTNHPSQPYGGFPAFHDESTIATWLRGAGYRTALIGKYLNGYSGSYVPPGWDRWFATWDGGGYYDYSANSNGTVTTFGSAPSDYSTDVLTARATGFIRSTDARQPLFLYFAPHGPHAPATPANRDAGAFPTLRGARPPSYDEADVSDKPSYIRQQPRLSASVEASVDRFRLDQYRSLRSIDRAVGSILDTLRATGRLSNTMIVFMSDNGMLWGEHRWHNKLVPYEESVKVPFVIRDDALIASPRSDARLVVNIDLAPTFAAVAGVAAPPVEGRSLLPLLTSSRGPWRSAFLMEHVRLDPGGVPTYCGVHSERYVYIDYVTGEEELYDLGRDPYELRNVVGRSTYAPVLDAMRARLKQLCRPQPPGFGFSF